MKDFEYRGWKVVEGKPGLSLEQYSAQRGGRVVTDRSLAGLLDRIDKEEDAPKTATEVIKESGRVFNRSVFFCPRCKREGLASVYRWLESTDRLGRPGQDVCTECANHLRPGTPDPKFFCSPGRE